MPPHLSGCGSSDLARNVSLLGEDRRLAGLGLAEAAVDADQVAEVEVLGPAPSRRRRPASGRSSPALRRSGPTVGGSGPCPWPRRSRCGRRRGRVGRWSSARFAGSLQHLGDGRVAVEAATPGVDAQFLDAAQLVGPAGFVLLFGHGGTTFGNGVNAAATVTASLFCGKPKALAYSTKGLRFALAPLQRETRTSDMMTISPSHLARASPCPTSSHRRAVSFCNRPVSASVASLSPD